MPSLTKLVPCCIASTRSGLLVITCVEDSSSVFLVDPETERTELIAGGSYGPPADGDGRHARFKSLYGLAVSEREHCAYVSDTYHNRICRITLPPHLFVARTVSSESLTLKG